MFTSLTKTPCHARSMLFGLVTCLSGMFAAWVLQGGSSFCLSGAVTDPVTDRVTLTASDGSTVVLRANPGGELVVESGDSDTGLRITPEGLKVMSLRGRVTLGHVRKADLGIQIERADGTLTAGVAVAPDSARLVLGSDDAPGGGVSLDWSSSGDGGMSVFRASEDMAPNTCNYFHSGAIDGQWGVLAGRREPGVLASSDRSDALQLVWTEGDGTADPASRLTMQPAPLSDDSKVTGYLEIQSTSTRQMIELKEGSWENVLTAKNDAAGMMLRANSSPRLVAWSDARKSDLWCSAGQEAGGMLLRTEDDSANLTIYRDRETRAASAGVAFRDDVSPHALAAILIYGDDGKDVVRTLSARSDGKIQEK